MLEVTLKHYTPMKSAVLAALVCTGREDKLPEYIGFSLTDKGKNLILGLIDKGHESVLEHVYYTFHVKGLSRAVLQELARHRLISLSVQSTRWALKKTGLNPVIPGDLQGADGQPDREAIAALTEVQKMALFALLDTGSRLIQVIEAAKDKLPNDIVKYFLPEGVETQLVMTVNLRELRHIYKLRTAPQALMEFQKFAKALVDALPDEHHRLFALR